MKRNINELQLQDIRIPIEDLKLFEIKCTKIPISALPAGARSPRLLTDFERISPHPSNLSLMLSTYKHRIAGVMLPRDISELQKIENRLLLNKNDMTLK